MTNIKNIAIDPDEVETAKEIVARMLADEQTHAVCAEEVGVTTRTITRWLRDDPEMDRILQSSARQLAKKGGSKLLASVEVAADNISDAVKRGDAKASMWLLTQLNIASKAQSTLGTDDAGRNGSKNAITIEVNTAPSSNAGNTVLHATRDAEVVSNNEHSIAVVDTSVVDDRA